MCIYVRICAEILNIQMYILPSGGMLTLTVHNREVILTMSHVSIEPPLLDKALIRPETLQMAQSIKDKYKGMDLIKNNCF